tara:strand:+ start:596 stop:868 length:273 start_codon:yes stop_codon:yes gene_type:complete
LEKEKIIEKNAEQTRKYTWTFEDGKKVIKNIDELDGNVVHALERVNALNVNIARLNSDLNDSIVLRDHYQSIAIPAFQNDEDDSEKSAED